MERMLCRGVWSTGPTPLLTSRRHATAQRHQPQPRRREVNEICAAGRVRVGRVPSGDWGHPGQGVGGRYDPLLLKGRHIDRPVQRGVGPDVPTTPPTTTGGWGTGGERCGTRRRSGARSWYLIINTTTRQYTHPPAAPAYFICKKVKAQ